MAERQECLVSANVHVIPNQIIFLNTNNKSVCSSEPSQPRQMRQWTVDTSPTSTIIILALSLGHVHLNKSHWRPVSRQVVYLTCLSRVIRVGKLGESKEVNHAYKIIHDTWRRVHVVVSVIDNHESNWQFHYYTWLAASLRGSSSSFLQLRLTFLGHPRCTNGALVGTTNNKNQVLLALPQLVLTIIYTICTICTLIY